VTLIECLAFMREGDVLTATKPDRLARSTAELLAIEADLSKRASAWWCCPWAVKRLDTRNPTSKLMLTILNPTFSSSYPTGSVDGVTLLSTDRAHPSAGGVPKLVFSQSFAGTLPSQLAGE
jgi:hypothetical protein